MFRSCKKAADGVADVVAGKGCEGVAPADALAVAEGIGGRTTGGWKVEVGCSETGV
jgi:hypothetical protein